jgi:hypothetical protein
VDHSAQATKKSMKKGGSKPARWSFVAVIVAGVLAVGHFVGGVAGLIEGGRTALEMLRSEQAPHETHLARLLSKLRDEFTEVKTNLQLAKATNFHGLETMFSSLESIDKNNPSVPYFRAEIARLQDTAHFDAETCLRLPDNKPIDLSALHSLFFHYLEAARSVVKKVGDTDARADSCYENETGVCKQRTAWVNHLLANDFYEGAVRTLDNEIAKGYLERAGKYAEAAAQYQSKEGVAGFTQCIETRTLAQKIATRLKALVPAAVASQKAN